MNNQSLPILVAALYRFTAFEEPETVRRNLAALCRTNGIKGTLLIAPEGLNGTIAGTDPGIARVVAHIRALPGCDAIEVKTSRTASIPFDRMKVRLKREIVTMGQPGLDPRVDAGRYIDPADWNAVIADPDTIVIDTRNAYEVALGSFDGAIDPGIRTFRDFPAWFRAFRAARKPEQPIPRVAMFCTGGIRCEKATAFLKAEGLDDVLHLKGGILAYLEAIPPDASRWQGECFVFDQRVTVAEDLAPGGLTLCRRCQQPIASGDEPVCEGCRR